MNDTGNGHHGTPPAGDSFAPPGPTRRALVADENPVVTQQVRPALEGRDPPLQVDRAGDGAEALALLLERNYSLLIADLHMPHLDGMQLIEQVKQRRLPVTAIV